MTPDQAHVAQALVDLGDCAPAWQIAVRVPSAADGRSVAPTLRRLEKRGLVASAPGDDGVLWSITDAGRKELGDGT